MTKIMERCIRGNLKGPNLAKARDFARKCVIADDGAAQLRAAADSSNPLKYDSQLALVGFRLIADELERNIASDARRKAEVAKIQHAIANGCPDCGAPMRRNMSMTGWYQCSQLGAEGFRRDPSKPSCNFQGFLDS